MKRAFQSYLTGCVSMLMPYVRANRFNATIVLGCALVSSDHCQVVCAQNPKQQESRQETVRVVQRFEQGKVRYTHAPKATARSGPSEESYATTMLPLGTRVEVYLETSNGWSGIRPPDGSHNWIPASSAFLLPGGKAAEIVNDNTPAWIGSSIESTNGLKWQTSLAKTQVVQVLGEQSQKSEDGTASLWYRIAPPQGEFRWIRTSALSDTPSASAEQQNAPNSTPAIATSTQSDSQVQLASHQESTKGKVLSSKVQQASGQKELGDTIDGKMVWSDEASAIAEAERLIREEQEAAMQGAPEGSLPEGSLIVGDEPESMPLESVEQAMTPQELAKAKRHQAAQHQVDSLKHWDSLQATDPKLRMKPLASVLGLVGFGIVEADRKPVRSQIATERQQFRQGELRYDSRLESVGPPGYNRLDRLPRPGKGPRVRAPLGSESSIDGSVSSYRGMESPYDESKPMLTRLWTADQPLFGGESNGMGMGSMAMESERSIPMDPEGFRRLETGSTVVRSSGPNEWHGISPASIPDEMPNDGMASEGSLAEADFHTPEIQSAMVELSRIVSQPTERWDLERLRRRCEEWIERGESSIVRGEARLLMDRVDRFDSLRTRTLGSMIDTTRLAGNSVPSSVMMASAVTAASNAPGVSVQAAGHVSNVPAGANASAGVGGAGYGGVSTGDASGWLVQVHGSLPGQPEYALTDDLGNVVTYVQSTAALNLRRYLQQPVVIRGQRGYIPSLAARQIVAESISRLR